MKTEQFDPEIRWLPPWKKVTWDTRSNLKTRELNKSYGTDNLVGTRENLILVWFQKPQFFCTCLGQFGLRSSRSKRLLQTWHESFITHESTMADVGSAKVRDCLPICLQKNIFFSFYRLKWLLVTKLDLKTNLLPRMHWMCLSKVTSTTCFCHLYKFEYPLLCVSIAHLLKCGSHSPLG